MTDRYVVGANGVYVRGARELRKQMRQAGIDMQRMRDTHRRIGTTVTAAARPATPRLTGALAATVRASGTQTATVVRAGYARVPYAGPIHWGWPNWGAKPRGTMPWRGGPIKAQPWLTLAAQSTEPAWLAIFDHDVGRILDVIKGAPQ